MEAQSDLLVPIGDEESEERVLCARSDSTLADVGVAGVLSVGRVAVEVDVAVAHQPEQASLLHVAQQVHLSRYTLTPEYVLFVLQGQFFILERQSLEVE